MKPDIILPNNPGLHGMACMTDGIPFFCEGTRQSITLISPCRGSQDGPDRRFPLVVFLQGSGWTSPNRFFQLPQLCRYAQQGIAVASITHRDCTQGHPFPAYLKDAKAAVRFLRSQADELGLDPDRIAFFGTSSGGNTALLVGLTGDDLRYQTDDYAGYSDAVRAVVDCFGPTDLLSYEGSELSETFRLDGKADIASLQEKYTAEDNGLMQIMFALIGRQDVLQVIKSMSPLHEVRDHEPYPPFLLVQGDADPVVPKNQSDRMHARLKAAGADSTLVEITGAEHEGTFWSEKVHELILIFLKKHLDA